MGKQIKKKFPFFYQKPFKDRNEKLDFQNLRIHYPALDVKNVS